MSVLYNRFTNISIIASISILLNWLIFSDILSKSTVSFNLFDFYNISLDNSSWLICKYLYFILSFLSTILLYFSFSSNKTSKTNLPLDSSTIVDPGNLYLKIGMDLNNNSISIIPEKGLYQNILITGTIGTGKTSSAMYPFLEQLINRNIGMLILDVKGNFHRKVLDLNRKYGRNVIVIELNGKYKYNPLDKPNLKPSVLANRLKSILTLLSNQNNSDSYWLDKVEIYLTECIKLCRLYNNGYVTFIELHKLINDPSYLDEKINYLKKSFLQSKLTTQEIFDFNTCLDFFQKEYSHLDQKVLSIIQSEVTRITQIFVSDIDISNTFCPCKSAQNFNGFSLNSNDIVVLNMNVAEYRNLSKIIATYLKLDFQSEVLMRL